MKTTLLAFLLFLFGCQHNYPTCEQFDIRKDSISLTDTNLQTIDVVFGCPIGKREIDVISIHQGDRSMVLQTVPNVDSISITATFSASELIKAGFSEGPMDIIPVRVLIIDFSRIQERKMGEGLSPPYYLDSKTIQLVR